MARFLHYFLETRIVADPIEPRVQEIANKWSRPRGPAPGIVASSGKTLLYSEAVGQNAAYIGAKLIEFFPVSFCIAPKLAGALQWITYFCCYTADVLQQRTSESWMQRAIQLAIENAGSGQGGPFGALVVRDGELIATGVNMVAAMNDPTAHAEIVAIRAACKKLGSFQLSRCEIYASCEPCPMCLGAIYWARLERFYYACTREAAAMAGFDDALIYDEVSLPPTHRSVPGISVDASDAMKPFDEWEKTARKVQY